LPPSLFAKPPQSPNALGAGALLSSLRRGLLIE
jgi:hypothetical protein